MIDPQLLAISRAIAETGWSFVPMAEWARRADLPLSEVHARFPHKFSILLAWHQAADRGMLADLSLDEREGPVLDRLFALLMRRFDVLSRGREALALLPDRNRGAPHLLLALTPHLFSSMLWVLEAAGLARGGILDVLRVKPLAFAYGLGLQAFMADPSPDLSETMKVLDLALKRIQAWPLVLPSLAEEPRSSQGI